MNILSSAFVSVDKKIRFLAYLIADFLVILPLIYAPGLGSYAFARYAVLGIFVLALGFFTTRYLFENRSEAKVLLRSIPFWVVIGYVLVYALVSLTGIDVSASFFSSFVRTDGWFTQFFLLIFFISSYLVVRRGGIKIVSSWLAHSVLGAVILSILIMLSPAGLDLVGGPMLTGSRGGGTIGNSSLAAIYVVWNIFFSVFLLLKTETRKIRLSWLAALIFLLSSSLFVNWYVLTGRNPYQGVLTLIGDARASVLALVVGGIVAALAWLAYASRALVRRTARVALVAVLMGSILLGGQILKDSSRLRSAFIDMAGSGRLLFWESALSGFKERPVIGFGPGTFSDVYHRYFDPARFQEDENIEALADKTHNIFFESLVTGGIVLTLALLLSIGTLMYLLFSFCRRERLLGSILVGATFAWLIQLQFVFESVASMVISTLVFAFVFSLTRAPYAGDIPVPLSRNKKYLVFGGYLVIALLIAVYTIALPFKKARLMNEVYQIELPDRAAAWETLHGISPMGDQYDSELMFNEVFNVYARSANQLRADKTPLREAAIDEIGAIGEYLSEIVLRGESRFELALLAAQFKYLQMYVANQFNLEELKRLEELALRAAEAAPHNIRATNLLEGVRKLMKTVPFLIPR